MSISSRAVVVAASLLACASCSARPPAPPVVEPERSPDGGFEEVGPLVYLGPCDDRVAPEGSEVAVRPDGERDFAFSVRIAGPVDSLMLSLSDARGNVVGGEIWDTYGGDTPIPPSLGVPRKLGRESYTLAIYDAANRLINPKITLEPRPHFFDGSAITLVAPDPWGNFREGRSFTLLVLRPGGRIDRTTVVIL